MAASRRRRKQKKTGLKALIGLLSVILIGMIILAACLPKDPDDPVQTGPSAPSTGSSPTGSHSQPTQPLKNGWVEEGGNTYYYDQGTLLTGVNTIEGKTYLFTSDGVRISIPGWQESDGKRYYLNEDGTLFQGWLVQEDGLYYLRSNGSMARGEEPVDGKSFYFTSAGRHIYMVNPWNYVPDDYAPVLMDLASRYAVEGQKVDATCYDALIEMMDACMKAGHEVCVVSSYRTQAHQEMLYNNQVIKQMNALGCTREEAEVIAATISAIPGTSEHQLGLAVDIIDTALWDLTEAQEDLPGQQWLMENSWRYGFILRYPKDKTDKTGIIYEPWHYRYVGIEVATELFETGLTLEEYLDALD